jgi:nicotinamidase-related amidase
VPGRSTGTTIAPAEAVPKSPRPKPAGQRRRPGAHQVALLLVDVINDLDFPGSGALIRAAEQMAGRLARLAARARAAGIPVIYVNDNFGRWQSDWRKVVQLCRDPRSPGHRVVRRLEPAPDDYFVLKPKHSGFFSTTLDLLLRNLRTRTVILTGIAADICILFTANDAYMRDYEVIVPRDCVAANTRRKTEFALAQIREVLKGRTPPSARIRFAGASAHRPRPGATSAAGTAARLLGKRSSQRRRPLPE